MLELASALAIGRLQAENVSAMTHTKYPRPRVMFCIVVRTGDYRRAPEH